MAIVHVDDKDFDNSIKKGTVLVDFYADWCGPCRMLSPIIEELVEQRDINVVKVNVDEANETARKFGIMSIPTIIVFKDGKEINKQVGLCSKEELEKMIK